MKEAVDITGKSQRTLRRWCIEDGIGRRIAGRQWLISLPALYMRIEGDDEALIGYRDGARAQFEPVARYFRRFDLGDLLQRPEFGAAAA
jgi:hypothetical protein